MKAWFTNSSASDALAVSATDAASAATEPPGRALPARFDFAADVARGYAIIVLLLVLLFAVGGTVPLSSAAIAPGVVGVAGQKKSIQHLEGGIVKKILVRDGDLVSAGQPLVELSDISARASYEDLNIRLIQAKAELLRWHAEQQGESDLDGATWTRVHANDPASLAAFETQRQVLRSRLAVFREKLANLNHQVSQAQEQIAGRAARVETLRAQSRLVDEELAEYQRLKASGMATRKQLFDLRQKRADINVDLKDSESTMAVARQLIAQLRSEMLELRGMRDQEAAENLDRLRDEVARLQQQLAAARNQLQRVVIESPIPGFAVNSVVHTTGGVIAPGQVIMEIIPTDEALIIDVKVDPKDRNAVREGQDAEIRFSAFDRRTTLPIKGKVTVISADRLLDPVTQAPYYKTSIALTEDPAVKLEGATLHPGMQAEAVIITGDRTILSYLVAPLARSFNRSFREE